MHFPSPCECSREYSQRKMINGLRGRAIQAGSPRHGGSGSEWVLLSGENEESLEAGEVGTGDSWWLLLSVAMQEWILKVVL